MFVVRHMNNPRMFAAEFQLCAGRVPFKRMDDGEPALLVKGEVIHGTNAIERYCARIAGTLPSRTSAFTSKMETIMDTCQSVVAELETTEDLEEFEKISLFPRLAHLLLSFEDDFYGGNCVRAPDVSLFNLLYQADTRGLTSWRAFFPELDDHFQTVSTVGHIPLYLTRKEAALR